MSKDRIQLSDHFTTGRLLRFVASPIIMMIFTSVYSVVDGFFISNFAGKTAFSALNLIYPFLQAFGCLGFMVGTGGSALVAMTLGTGDKKQADNLFSMLAASTIVMGIVSTIIGWFLLEPAAQLLGATPELLPNCLMYGRILLVFQTAFMMQFFFQSFFITSEKPKLGLAFTVLAGLTNIVLDFLLVGVLRGGIVGAASATVISQMVGGIGPMFYFFNRKIQPAALCTAQVQRQSAGQGLRQRLQRADDQLVGLAGQCAVQPAADEAHRRRRRGGLRRVDVRGLYLCSGVHRLCPGLCAHHQLPLWC